MDLKVLKLRPDVLKSAVMSDDEESIPLFDGASETIVEWRAMTIALIDRLLPKINEELGLNGTDKLILAQLLEAGTWTVSLTCLVAPRTNLYSPAAKSQHICALRAKGHLSICSTMMEPCFRMGG